MNKVSKPGQVFNFVLYLTLQVAVARFIVLPHTACFVYVGFFLLLPRWQEGLTTLLLVSFAVGLLVDIFFNDMGTHAFASVLMVYSRSLLLKLMLPTSGYEAATQPTLDHLGCKRFSLFALPLIGLHHAALFFLDAGSSLYFFVTMRKLISSALLTYIAFLITQIPTCLLSRR